ncbi:protein-S-isoprenylcysteine O-methyltransferase, putative [Entamoeba invadens IP1]|uniref:Protein-S-isoprenylcysteine O-methyltransferase n=1 Tax=Entamoeba invadens IP1 TaxID=370355 RepID=A0A0A1U3N3_ENTIV|nr:protein-S-isoprenylcysteine O-methyltransferase, putative [Entamoeba invadens IP1]ELP88704.1 protein-S-isoprenylcysteine O-methyltransferase, putative [Entamoeba invadens IP1]|eukprot:XP_004255475.1 protein-S-isoprenylcysteine O-methyltransferase, putative [Entamoeba invadens IP1]
MIQIGCHEPSSFEKRLDVMVMTGVILGFLIGVSIGLLYSGVSFPNFLIFVILFFVFHILEFMFNAVNFPKETSFASYLLTHSKEFLIAFSSALTEYWIEFFIFPELKTNPYIYITGLVVCVVGQVMRSVAMFYAQSNFNHIIETEKRESHQLVDDFIYKYLRHPSYTGWFYWSVFSQVVLCNPICLVLYIYASWTFFEDRIPYEEATLYEQFGEKYCDYMKKTYILIPCITSVNPPNKKLL